MGIEFSLAFWIYENYAIVRLPWNSPWTWIIAFILVDFSYYWFHRAAHGIIESLQKMTILEKFKFSVFAQKLIFFGPFIKCITALKIIISPLHYG